MFVFMASSFFCIEDYSHRDRSTPRQLGFAMQKLRNAKRRLRRSTTSSFRRRRCGELAGHLQMLHPHENNGANDNHSPPGDGRIDWEEFLRDLLEVRFRGAFILEMAGNDDPAVTMTNARPGRQYLREVSR